jgi:hypothetical protein
MTNVIKLQWLLQDTIADMLVSQPLYSHPINDQPRFYILLEHMLRHIPLLHEEQTWVCGMTCFYILLSS